MLYDLIVSVDINIYYNNRHKFFFSLSEHLYKYKIINICEFQKSWKKTHLFIKREIH